MFNNINNNIKSIKTRDEIIKSDIPALNVLRDNKIISEQYKEVEKLLRLSMCFIYYVNDRYEYESKRKKPKGSINITIEQPSTYLLCFSIELLLKSLLYKQNGTVKIDNKLTHDIIKIWDNIKLNIDIKNKYNKFIHEVSYIYGESGDVLRFNQNVSGKDFDIEKYNINVEILLNNTKNLFNDIEGIIRGE